MKKQTCFITLCLTLFFHINSFSLFTSDPPVFSNYPEPSEAEFASGHFTISTAAHITSHIDGTRGTTDALLDRTLPILSSSLYSHDIYSSIYSTSRIDAYKDSRVSSSTTYDPLLSNCNSWLQLSDLNNFEGIQDITLYSVLNLDTMIGSYIYKKIKLELVYSNVSPLGAVAWYDTTLVGYEYYREDTISQRVFRYNFITSSDEMIYDFDMNIGDTLVTFDEMATPILNIIVSITATTLIDGSTRETFIFDTGLKLIEGIGMTSGAPMTINEGVIRFYNDTIVNYLSGIVEYDTLAVSVDTSICKDVILSINLLEFHAKTNCEQTEIFIKTLIEPSTERIELEYSLDGKQWVSIYTFETQKNNSNFTYLYECETCEQGYYRIASYEKNGKKEYSKMISSQYDCNTIQEISIRPNPSAGIFYLNTSVSEIQIFDTNGRLIQTKLKTDHIDLSEYTGGIYYARCITNNKQIKQLKLIKSN